MDREGRVNWISRNLVPVLDRRKWESEIDDEKREAAEQALAIAIYDELRGTFQNLGLILLVVVVIDLAWVIPGQVYGLAIDLWGTWLLLAWGGIQGRYAISRQASRPVGPGYRDPWDLDQMTAMAEQTVINIKAVFFLTVGFLGQIIAITHVRGDVAPQLIPWVIGQLV